MVKVSASPFQNYYRGDHDEDDGQNDEAYRLRIADEVSLLEVGVILVFPIEPPRSVHNAQGRDDNHGHPKAGESFLGTRFWT